MAKSLLLMSARFRLLAVLCAIIACGIASRMPFVRSVPIVHKELGDVLWAIMFYVIVLIVRPTLKPATADIIALLISWGTELSQLYQASWINALRDTRIGGLLLGRYFRWEDMACHVIGTAIAMACHAAWRRRTSR